MEGLPPCLNDIVANAYQDDSVDVDDDDLLSAEEWHSFFSARLGLLLTVSEVVDWIIYAVQKPQYADAFQRSSVSGLDFIDLVRNGGQLLKDELGIQNESARNKIRRQMILVLCTQRPIAKAPVILPVVKSIHGAEVKWKAGDQTSSMAPVLFFQLQRSENGGKFSDIQLITGDTGFIDVDIINEGLYGYRIQAWTAFGRSGWSTVAAHHIASSEIYDSSFLASLMVILLVIPFLMQLCWSNREENNIKITKTGIGNHKPYPFVIDERIRHRKSISDDVPERPLLHSQQHSVQQIVDCCIDFTNVEENTTVETLPFLF